LAEVSWPAKKMLIDSSRSSAGGHRLALLVAPFDQRVEQVVVLRATLLAGLDQPDDQPVERRHRALERDVVGRGEPQRHRERHEGVARDVALHPSERNVELARVGAELVGEHRLHDDVAGQAHHQIVAVVALAVAECVGVAPGDLAHRVGELGDARLVEGGLHGAPLAAPDLGVGHRQAVAEHRPDRIDDPAARIVLVLFLQHTLDVFRVRDQRHRARSERDAEQRTELGRGAQHEAGRVLEHRARRAQDRNARRGRRTPARAGEDGRHGVANFGILHLSTSPFNDSTRRCSVCWR
jgi:hypothetical protein